MAKQVGDKIRNFFLTNQVTRKIRSFFHQTLFPILFKGSILLVVLLVFLFAMLKFFKPVYLEKIYQKSSFYFFHYLNLDNHEFNQINIEGNKNAQKEEILAIVESVKKQITLDKNSDYQPLIRSLIDRIKSELPWVNQVVITRSMPNILNISITEYEPFAIWQNDGAKYLTDKEGNLIPYEDREEFQHMVILSGKGANNNAKSLFNIFASDPNLSANVYSATWVSNRRWDIRFDNGLLIKLPENNISEAWQRLIRIYNMPGSIVGLKNIDLRISDKTYLEYDDSVIKELRSL
jgi:cell division protein FtsQ